MGIPLIRSAVVAGRFYPAKPETLRRDLEIYLTSSEDQAGARIEGALGCVVPHAGYKYSGPVAGAVYRKLPARSSYIILCPNHTGCGAPLAVMSRGSWETPLGEAHLDQTLAGELSSSCRMLTEDSAAHAREHSLEVQLPFLQHLVGSFRFVPVAVGLGNFSALEILGRSIARTIAAASKPVLVIASSDMNHNEPDAITRIKDRKAIDKILELDPRGLHEVIEREEISMCGYGPTIAMLTAAKEMGAKKAELVKYATSADSEESTGRERVVGYAGIIVS